MKGGDAIVVGLGTAGAATCMTLAQRGTRVLGIDAHQPPHRLGSHHGHSRSVRRAYLEGTAYVPLAQRAWALWRKLEAESGRRLLITTPNLTIGPSESPALSGFLTSAVRYGIPHEHLTAVEVVRRWPQLKMPESFAAGLEKRAGIVFPEKGIRVCLERAQASGARLRFNEPVCGWTDRGGRIAVRTARDRYETGRLLLAAGAGIRGLLGAFGTVLTPKRVPVHWIAPPPGEGYRLGRFPVNFWQVPVSGADGAVSHYKEFYALPALEAGGPVKTAYHNGLTDWDSRQPMTMVSAAEERAIRSDLDRFLPELAARPLSSDLCAYTLTPDGDFLMGPLPDNPSVFAVALAGHGFKFAPALGEVLADLIQGQRPRINIDMFSYQRFLPQPR